MVGEARGGPVVGVHYGAFFATRLLATITQGVVLVASDAFGEDWFLAKVVHP